MLKKIYLPRYPCQKRIKKEKDHMVNNKDNLFDKRVIEKNIAEGIVSKTDYEEYLANLLDVSNKTEYIPLPHNNLMLKKRGLLPFHSNS